MGEVGLALLVASPPPVMTCIPRLQVLSDGGAVCSPGLFDRQVDRQGASARACLVSLQHAPIPGGTPPKSGNPT